MATLQKGQLSNDQEAKVSPRVTNFISTSFFNVLNSCLGTSRKWQLHLVQGVIKGEMRHLAVNIDEFLYSLFNFSSCFARLFTSSLWDSFTLIKEACMLSIAWFVVLRGSIASFRSLSTPYNYVWTSPTFVFHPSTLPDVSPLRKVKMGNHAPPLPFE